MTSLANELKSLPLALALRLKEGGFNEEALVALAATLKEGDPLTRRRTRNIVKGKVIPPPSGSIIKLAAEGSPEHERLSARGLAAMRAGELAFCTMAGGMATRMGGIVKALCEACHGHTFLDLRLRENRSIEKRVGRPLPLWFMTSEATHDAIVRSLEATASADHTGVFMQNLSVRLTPTGSLFKDADGVPSLYATGHGDLVDALRRSGLLDRFIAAGGKWVWIANIDNLGASVDFALLGHFIEAVEKQAADVQCEVCRKEGDRGGIPVLAEGKLQVLEEFRLPPDFDPKAVNVFNTNTFLVRAEALAKTSFRWTYFEVEKTISGRPAVQFERLLQEITAQLPSVYVEVPRDGVASRFLPVKDFDELARRRQAIEEVAAARGML
ncbi:MAG: UTP--glucose-1-phosphate uridylyltransferase [Polyangiaceae bacterium]|nr:UTP--glucose-1-phosphate uridylyltransferase [Polyangiaceae bacterium]